MGQQSVIASRGSRGKLPASDPNHGLTPVSNGAKARLRRLVGGLDVLTRVAAEGWTELDRTGRRGLLALVTAAAVLVLVQIVTARDPEREIADAEGRGLRASVAALEPALPDLSSRKALSEEEFATVDRLLTSALIDTGRVRVKLWSLDGTILYSDAAELVGRRYPEVRPRLRQAAARGIYTERNAAEPENAFERGSGPLAEHYIAVHPADGGPPVAVLETYGPVDPALGIAATAELVSHAGLSVVIAMLGGVVVLGARSSLRRRELRLSLAHRFQALTQAAGSVVASLDAEAVLERLRPTLVQELKVEWVELCDPADAPEGARTVPLADGRVLAAGRREPMTVAELESLSDAARAVDLAARHAARLADVQGTVANQAILLHRISLARVEERRRLVAELHDMLAATLVRTLFAVRRAEGALGPYGGAVSVALQTAERLVEEAEDQLRRFMGDIDSPMDGAADLRSTARSVVDRFAAESGCRVMLRMRGDAGSVNVATSTALLRALGEALVNVEKHARASSVRVNLWLARGLVYLAVVDDGVGWPVSVRHAEGRGFGIRQLEERLHAMGGKLCMSTGRRGGARFVISMPLRLGTT